MNINVTWKDVLSNPEQVQRLIRLVHDNQAHIARLKEDFVVELVKRADLETKTGTAAGLDTDAAKLADKAENAPRGKFDASQHLMVWIEKPCEKEPLRKGGSLEDVRMLWLKPKRGGYRRINLDKDEATVHFEAYED